MRNVRCDWEVVWDDPEEGIRIVSMSRITDGLGEFFQFLWYDGVTMWRGYGGGPRAAGKAVDDVLASLGLW